MANLVLLFEEEENEEQSSAVEATCKKCLLQGRGNKYITIINERPCTRFQGIDLNRSKSFSTLCY